MPKNARDKIMCVYSHECTPTHILTHTDTHSLSHTQHLLLHMSKNARDKIVLFQRNLVLASFSFWASRSIVVFCHIIVAVCCSVLQYVAVCRSVSQCVAVCCSVFQHVAMCCNVLLCDAMCCSVLASFSFRASRSIVLLCQTIVPVCCSVSQCVAVCCRVLRCVAVCDSVLRCVAVCCGISQRIAVCHFSGNSL